MSQEKRIEFRGGSCKRIQSVFKLFIKKVKCICIKNHLPLTIKEITHQNTEFSSTTSEPEDGGLLLLAEVEDVNGATSFPLFSFLLSLFLCLDERGGGKGFILLVATKVSS